MDSLELWLLRNVLPKLTFFQKSNILVMKPARCWSGFDKNQVSSTAFLLRWPAEHYKWWDSSVVARVLLYSSARSKTLSSLRTLHSLSPQILSPLLVTKLFLNSRQPGVVLISMVAMIKDAIIVTMVKVSEKCGMWSLPTTWLSNMIMLTAQPTWLQVLGELCSPSPGEPPPLTSLPIATPRLRNLVIMVEKHG